MTFKKLFFFLTGGEIFGYAHDEPGELAKTMLAVMAKCFFSSEKFLVKLIPIHALNSEKLFNYLSTAIETVESCGATVFGLLSVIIIGSINPVSRKNSHLFHRTHRG